MTLSVLSLFAGIGGLDLGLERAGDCKTRWYSEVDPYACRVMAARFPDAVNLGDITTIDWTTTDARPDIICGGFPCQDISLAGKGAGIAEGTRSGLWSHYADAIRILRPRLVIVENVAALLARGIGRVLGDLAACGYDAEWDCIPAASVGAPHRRDRIFIIATREHAGEIHSNPTPMHWSTQQRRKPNRDTECVEADARSVEHESDGQAEWRQGTEGIHGRSADHWSVEPNVGRVAHGIPRELDGAAVDEGGDPQAGSTSRADDDGVRGVRRGKELAAAPSRLQQARTGGDPVPEVPRSRGSREGGVGHGAEGNQDLRDMPSRVLGVQPQQGQDLLASVSERARPDQRGEAPRSWWEAEPAIPRVAQGVDKRVDRLRCLGNAVVPQVAEYVARIALARLSPVMHP